MILADKIIYLRKKAGWSQEELAEEMNVSRQSVSKWEGAQSVPEMDKILMLSSIFGVSTDFLLKDELEELDGITISDSNVSVRKVSIEEASSLIEISQVGAPRLALGVFLCIMSPTVFLLLTTLQESGKSSLSSNMATFIGLAVILISVACAVGIFIFTSSNMKATDFLDTDQFELQYGVESIIREQQEKNRPSYLLQLVIGIGLCIIAALPLLFFSDGSEIQVIIGLITTLFLVACGVFTLVRTVTRYAIYDKILQEGDYQPQNKKSEKIIGIVASIYWTVIVTVYLAYSFVTSNWAWSWAIFPVAGVLFGGIAGAISIFHEGE